MCRSSDLPLSTIEMDAIGHRDGHGLREHLYQKLETMAFPTKIPDFHGFAAKFPFNAGYLTDACWDAKPLSSLP